MSDPIKPEMVTEEQALAKYTYRPMERVGSVGTLKALLQAQEKALAAVLPKHLTPDRLFRTLLTAINRQPDLLECTQASIVESVGRAAELGLDVSGTLQEAWILPFNNKVGKGDQAKWMKQAQLLPGYRGLAKLARNSGEVAKLEARVIKEHDFFELEYGSNPKLTFKPLLKGDRGATVSCYAFAKLVSGEEVVDWMTVEEVEKVRAKSKQPDSLMWRESWDEGARKTIFRRLSKWLPLSAEKSAKFLDALAESDKEFDLDRFAEAVNITPPAPIVSVADIRTKPEPKAQPGPDPNVVAAEPEPEPTPKPQPPDPKPASPFPSRRRRESGPVRGAEYLESLAALASPVLTQDEIVAFSEKTYGKAPLLINDTDWLALSQWVHQEIEKAEPQEGS